MYNRNLWNEKSRLSPKFDYFHIGEHTFRKRTIDFDQIASDQKEELKTVKEKQLFDNKKERQDRQQARTLERKLLSYRAEQPLTPEELTEVQALEDADP